MPITVNREAVEATVCRLAAEQAAVTVAEVTADTHLVHDLNFDSLAMVEFTMKIEDAFDVTIPDERAEQVKTIRDAVELLISRLPSPRD